MPNYDYHCTKCAHKLEIFQKITEEPLKNCPDCQSLSLQRGPGGGIGLAFKGPGFYINDYNPARNEDPSPAKTIEKSACCPCGKNASCSS